MIAVFLTTPYLFHSFTIYPEVIGGLCVTGALWLLIELDDGRPVSTRSLVIVGVLLATLPWLHSRFAVLAALLGLFVIARLGNRSNGLHAVVTFLAVPSVAAAACASSRYSRPARHPEGDSWCGRSGRAQHCPRGARVG